MLWGLAGCNCMVRPSPASSPSEAVDLPVAQVLESIALPGICEPSGASVHADGSIWIVDDDQDTVLFRWEGQGSVPERVALADPGPTPLVQDMEGLAWRERALWILGSHSRTSKGKLKRRARVVRWSQGDAASESGVFSLWPDAKRAEPWPIAEAVARECAACRPAEDWSQLNLEGMAWSPDGKALMVGLRTPVDADGTAFVLALDPETASGESVPAIRAVHRLALGGAGVRAMSPSPSDDALWLVAGATSGRKAGYILSSWTPGAAPQPVARLPELAGAPEAVVALGPTEALLFIDEGKRLKKLADRVSGTPHRSGSSGDGDFACGVGADPADPTMWAHAIRVGWAKTVSPASDFR